MSERWAKRDCLILWSTASSALRGFVDSVAAYDKTWASRHVRWIAQPTARGWARHVGTPCGATRGLGGCLQTDGWEDGDVFVPWPSCYWCGFPIVAADEPEKHKQRVAAERAAESRRLRARLETLETP